jgi:hypothetical protein
MDRSDIRQFPSVLAMASRRAAAYTCYWFSLHGWTPWQIFREPDALGLVAETAGYDRKEAPKEHGPDTWHRAWKQVYEAAVELVHATPPKRRTRSTALKPVPTIQLKKWLVKARKDGGVYQPRGWGRHFTIANLTAELHTRPDRALSTKPYRKALRQQRARMTRRRKQ